MNTYTKRGLHKAASQSSQLILIALLTLAGTVKTSMAQSIDTSNWKTYCVGHYLIDLPSDFAPELETFDKVLGYEITWDKSFTNRKQVEERIAQMKAILDDNREIADPKQAPFPRKDGKPYFDRIIEYPNGGLGLLAFITSSGTGRKLYNFFITENPFRVFRYDYERIGNSVLEDVLAKNRQLAERLRSRETHEIPTGPGICIDGGLIVDGPLALRAGNGISLNYPYYSEKYYWQIGMGTEVMREAQTVHPRDKEADYPPIVKVLRDSDNKRLADMQGMEYALERKSNEHPGIPFYDYMWAYPGEPNSDQRPSAGVYMGYVIRDYMKEKPAPLYLKFPNAEQASTLWDTILSTVRRRANTPLH